jgi:hypothetical protein
MLQALKPNSSRKRVAKGKSIPAPVEGWDAVSPLSAMKPTRAIVLDNWFPQPGYVEVRKGYADHVTGMGASTSVESLMAYHGLTTASDKMFAVASGSIYDVSSSGAVGAAVVTGFANSRFQYVNYTTSANVAYIWICNGTDAPQHYNGSVWATPAITVVSEEDTINANVYKKRIWGVLRSSMDAYYLPLDAVAGAATKFPLGSIFQKGGYLVAMATWTLDSGEGPDDYAVFITSKGQVAVYGGYDPTDATNFLLKGIFDLPAPIGYRCFCKIGADLAVITIGGVLPLSKAIQVDKSQESAISFTLRINNAMNTAAQSYSSNFGWDLTTFPKGTMAVLNVPLAENSTSHQYVMNTITGAWCRFTGWNANCFCVFQDNLYFGSNVGTVEQAWTGSIDGEETIEADGQTAYNYFGDTGINKRFTALQPLITTDQTVVPSLGLSTDYKDNATISTPSATSTASALYDSAIYDTDVYSVEGRSSSDWTTVGNIGQCAAVHFRASAQATGAIITQLNGFNITYATGEFY